MDHLVYLDIKAKELEKLFDGSKTMLIRSSMGKKRPYGVIESGDRLFLVNNYKGVVKAIADVKEVFCSDKLTEEESIDLIRDNQEKLQLTDTQAEKWAGKRYVILIEIESIRYIVPFAVDDSVRGMVDDWIVVKDIDQVIA